MKETLNGKMVKKRCVTVLDAFLEFFNGLKM